MRTPKVTLKSDLPNIIFLNGAYVQGGTVLGFNFEPLPQVSFDVNDHDPAYDYVAAAGFVNFPLMYRENRTDYPVFHNTFWKEDVERTGIQYGTIAYETLSGYDSSKSDEENAPYVAMHCTNRPQLYCTDITTTDNQNSKCTNFEEFEVTFDYKVDDFNSSDPQTTLNYCFLYHQSPNATDHLRTAIYITQVTGGTVIFVGDAPQSSQIDVTTGTTTKDTLYISSILTIDWTSWQSIKVVTKYVSAVNNYIVYLYVNDTQIPLHAGNASWDRTDGGVVTNYALSYRFNNFCTRNAYYTGGYWLKNFRIRNIFPENSYTWSMRISNSDFVHETQNTFRIRYYNGNAVDHNCESDISLQANGRSYFSLHGYYQLIPENVLSLAINHDNTTQTMVWNPTVPHGESNFDITDPDIAITDNSTTSYNYMRIPYRCYPLETDQTTVYQDSPFSSWWLYFGTPNPVFQDNWCIISPTQSVDASITGEVSIGYRNIGMDFFIRITEADIPNMSGVVPIMTLFKTYVSGGYFPGTARTFRLCFIPGIDNDHGILGYWAVVSDGNKVMSKYPYYKTKSVSHVAATYSTATSITDFRTMNVFINGSLIFSLYYKNGNKVQNQINDSFGQMFRYGGGQATGFSGAMRSLRVYAFAGYINYVNADRAFFRNQDTINFMDLFDETQLGLSAYWSRAEAVASDQYFDPFTSYPNYQYPSQMRYLLPSYKWTNETTGEDLGTGSITAEVLRSSVIRGVATFPEFFGEGLYIPEDSRITLNIARHMPPTAVIVSAEGMTVYKGAYVLLDGSGSYDEITGYLWSNGATTDKISVQIMETTTFTLTVTNPYGTDSATITIICKEVPEISKKADIVSVTVIGQEIPLSPIPYQELMILLNGQNCIITVRQLGLFLYCSLSVDGRKIFSNVICSINARVNVFKSPYFTGILRFYDTQGTERPHYSELGSRWILVYRAEELPGEFE